MENKIAYLVFIANTTITFIIAVLFEVILGKEKEKNARSVSLERPQRLSKKAKNRWSIIVSILCILICCACAVAYVLIPIESRIKVPASLSVKSYNTIPFDILTENDIDYFESKQYLNIKLLVSDDSSPTPSAPKISTSQPSIEEEDDGAVEDDVTGSEPTTFSEYMSMAYDNVEHLMAAYELYLAGNYHRTKRRFIPSEYFLNLRVSSGSKPTRSIALRTSFLLIFLLISANKQRLSSPVI